MPIESHETQYRPLFRCWPRGDALTVSFAPGGLDLVVRLPLAFVSSSADPTHAFVERIAQVLVDESGSLRRKSAPDEVLEPRAAPSADDYIFVPDVPCAFAESRGPQGKRRTQAAPLTTDGESSVGASSHSRREMPLHQVVRPPIYAALTGSPFLFEASAGLLLNPMLHKAYDDYEWSLYCKDNEYHFVAFNGQLSSVKEHHGKVLTTVDMRDEDPPDPVLCAWHFEQAVMRSVRAYSVRMAINAQ
ncbi:hypothetical protein Rhopal_005697-T1 [Rhodotorula paludigena]|uniref:HNH nuclease domain-containing protein n=1 Tax=Rhodotorula paludigena TaxID=86838 RepID=A0AAV5GUE0_9BASI|nr:hypothetical protein Rhopal_005697-T1 [Rhodotorula paludigena]